VGTPACSTLGMDEPEMREIASILGGALKQPEDEGALDKARAQVRDLTQRFPLYA
jgi:glycine hydroxymethyltransferase